MNTLRALSELLYRWPTEDLAGNRRWRSNGVDGFLSRELPEDSAELAADSRWPAFFPSPVCLVTTNDGTATALEKVVGPSIVNRFPYVMALSFCRKRLSDRHHVRGAFSQTLERGGVAAIQFLPPGSSLKKVMDAIVSVPEERSGDRIAASGLATRSATTNTAPLFEDAYLAYEARLVQPGKDFSGRRIYEKPWIDVGSHRIYLLEINAIQLRRDVADGRNQIHWRGLPTWRSKLQEVDPARSAPPARKAGKYVKGYTPHYRFPSAQTVAFEFNEIASGMAIKHLPPLPEDQVEVDNDRARWPCFFPSSVGMITSWGKGDVPNLMPCGSTTVVSRQPFVIAPCVSYGAINERYAPRVSLEIIRERGWFGCGVPYVDDAIVQAIRYAGTTPLSEDPDKVANTGLRIERRPRAPMLPDLPVHFECKLIGEERLGTHVMFLGEVTRIFVRKDVAVDNPLQWCPWADVVPTER